MELLAIAQTLLAIVNVTLTDINSSDSAMEQIFSNETTFQWEVEKMNEYLNK